MSSQLILNNHIANDEWQLIEPPKAQEEVKKQGMLAMAPSQTWRACTF